MIPYWEINTLYRDIEKVKQQQTGSDNGLQISE